jgi:hypothetical protein
MQAPALHVQGSGRSFAILHGRHIVARATSNGNAIAALRGVEARLAPVITRPCLGCSAPMTSTGKGHRLCPTCRKGA